jgi:hypothetical protein
MGLIQSLMSVFQTNNPVVKVNSVYGMGFKGESEALVKKRDAAKENLKSWGRKTMLEGGAFSRNTTILMPAEPQA